MEKLTINGKKEYVKKVSELTFKEFNEVMVKREVVDLKEYIAAFTGLKVGELMNARLKSRGLPEVHASLFDTNIEEVLRDKKETVTFRDKVYSVDSLELDTFGKHYLFELKAAMVESGDINQYDLCLWALSLALSKEEGYGDAEKILEELQGYDWRKVLPQAFFWPRSSGRVI